MQQSSKSIASAFLRLALVTTLALTPACRGTRAGSTPAYETPTTGQPVGYSTTPSARSASSTIEAGDKLDVVVLEDPSFNGAFVVRESGDIILPKVGRVRVAGVSLASAEGAVRSRIQADQIKDATVILERTQRVAHAPFSERSKMLVFLTGAVARPGQHMVALNDRDGLMAYEALLIAGGPTPYADQRRAYILRKAGGGQRERIAIDFRSLARGEGTDMPLQQGDVVYLPERRFGL